MVTRVPLFAKCSAEFVADLVKVWHCGTASGFHRAHVWLMHTLCLTVMQALDHRLYMPGDYVIHYGQYGSEMFFINSGELDVLHPDGSMVLASLGPGEFFGELALLARMRRTATIQARAYCDLSVFAQFELDRLLDRYPEVEPTMREVARQRVEVRLACVGSRDLAHQDTCVLTGIHPSHKAKRVRANGGQARRQSHGAASIA